MDLQLTDRVAIVAGASAGLGKAVALELAREGASVVICARGEERLRETEAELHAAAGDESKVLALALDIAASTAAHDLVEAAVARFGTVHVVVPNAGGPPPGHAFSFDDDALAAAFEAGCAAQIRLAQAAIPHMRETGWGRICFVSGTVVRNPNPSLALSSTVRAGLSSFVASLATELAPYGITSNMVLAGRVATDRITELGLDATGVPMARLGRPEEFAAAVTFLCSSRASFITGTALEVDGGMSCGVLARHA